MIARRPTYDGEKGWHLSTHLGHVVAKAAQTKVFEPWQANIYMLMIGGKIGRNVYRLKVEQKYA